MARRRPSLPSRSVTGWYGASFGPGATAAPNSAPSAGASGADEGPPPAPAGDGATTATNSITAVQLRACTTSGYARNSGSASAGGTRFLYPSALQNVQRDPGTLDDVSGRPPVLALHGQPGSGRDFEPLGRALAGEWRMVAPDRPGWGSRAGEPARGFAAGADDAVAVLDREGVDRAIVLGFSWGGGVALELARRHPDRVGGLVLAASIGPGEPTVADRLLALPVAGRAISAGGLAATRLVLRRPSFHGIVGRGMKGVDPNHVRRFVDDCM